MAKRNYKRLGLKLIDNEEYVPRRQAVYKIGRVLGKKTMMLLDYNQHVCAKYGCKKSATVCHGITGGFDLHLCLRHSEARDKAMNKIISFDKDYLRQHIAKELFEIWFDTDPDFQDENYVGGYLEWNGKKLHDRSESKDMHSPDKYSREYWLKEADEFIRNICKNEED